VRIAAETFNRPAAMRGENIEAAPSATLPSFKISTPFRQHSPQSHYLPTGRSMVGIKVERLTTLPVTTSVLGNCAELRTSMRHITEYVSW
jgi:hypothetical protein